MSVLGTSVAAGVAQTGLQAQQVARRRDRANTSATADARRVRELLEQHMRALEEADEFESTDQLHIDGQLPEHRGPLDQQPGQGSSPVASPLGPGTPGAAGPPDPEGSSSPLYQHVDVRA